MLPPPTVIEELVGVVVVPEDAVVTSKHSSVEVSELAA